MTTIDISFSIGTETPRVGTLDLDTGAVGNVSPPMPTINTFDARNHGAGLGDGRYAFVSQRQLVETGSPVLLLNILNSARSEWTVLVTDVELNDFNDKEITIVDIDDGKVMIAYDDFARHKRTLDIDLTTGLSNAYTDWGMEESSIDGGIQIRQPFHAMSRTLRTEPWVLTTAGTQRIYRLPPDGVGDPVWVDNDGSTADLGPPPFAAFYIAPAYHTDRQSVIVWEQASSSLLGSRGIIREFSYPTPLLANTWILPQPAIFNDPDIADGANALAVDDYYVLADGTGAGSVGVFRFSTGEMTTLSLVLDATLAAIGTPGKVLMIPNTVGEIPNLDGLLSRQDVRFWRPRA